MSNASDFIIENGVLTKYVGPGGDVVIPDSVTIIGHFAFSGCKNLTKIAIPNSVTKIGYSAFWRCESLASITIPDSVISIEDSAFRGCKKLADANGVVIIRNVLYDYYGTSRAIVIPDGVEKISACVFYNYEQLQTVTIPESVTEIGTSAFAGCLYLKQINGADNVKFVGDVAFERCWSLEKVTLKNATKLGYKAFDRNSRFKTFFAPNIEVEEIKKIDAMKPAATAFLLHSDAYHNPTIIAEYEKYISAQKKRLLPEVFSADAVHAISLYDRLGKIKANNVDEDFLTPAYEAGAQQCVAFLLDWKEKNVSPEYVERQMQRELEKDPYNVADMKKIWRYRSLSDGSLEIYGYKGTSPNVILPEYIGKYPVTAIEEGAFKWDKNGRGTIVSISIPESVTKIGPRAFQGCTELRRVELFCKLTVIDDYLFDQCKHLESIVVPNGVTKIGSGAFSGCRELKSAVIPEGVISIGPSFLRECFNLCDLWLPMSVSKINKQAFKDCSQLTIHAPAGSYAEEYAKKNKIRFVAEE